MKNNLLIKDVLERDPTRQIERIIKVDEQDPRIVGSELEEYVVTDEIKGYLEDIIDRFIESRHKTPESVCGWISGFFGSGKSHFLKVLGYLLSNRKILLEDGREVGAATYLCTKHSLLPPGKAIIEKELKTKAIFVNMLNFPRDDPKAPSITRIIYTALLEDSGLSDIPWIAEIEKMVQERKLWEKFLAYIEKETGKSWQDVRKITVMAGPLLAKALCELDPKTYYSIERAEKSIDEVKQSFELTPRKLVELLVKEAEKLDKDNGRIVLLLDEVGLYIGTDTDRLTDLNILAEEIERIGRGKVWLFVTAQEALEDVLPRIEAYRGQFEKIKDRFQIKVTLTPENIGTVVKKRLLSKTPDRDKLKSLEELYNKYSGSLATSALIKNPAREYGGLLTSIEKNSFIESYPLMPYHTLLMQQIFTQLRLRGRTIPELLGVRERAILSVVRALLVGPTGDVEGLAKRELGSLATFDMVYDAIHLEIRGEYQSMMEEIGKLGEKDGLKVSSVAKALFLLQQVGDWIPCTVENISALLYPRLGEDGNALIEKVKACLEELRKNRWIVEDEGKWRFLTNIERTFEQDVASKVATIIEKRNLAFEIIKSVVNEFKTYNYEGKRVFDVHLFVDDREVPSKGHLNLRFYSPLTVEGKDFIKTLLPKSLANSDTIFVVCESEKRFEELLEKIICTEKAINEREAKPLSKEIEETLTKYRRDIDVLKNDELPRLFLNACKNGTILIRGKEIKLDGRKSIQDVVKQYLKEVVEDLFTQFHLAAYKVEKDEHIGSILTWQKGKKLPPIYRDLQLIDDKGNVLVDRPVASRILQEIIRRNKEGEETSGASLIEVFNSPPYGWDPRIVRMTLATLFKNGSIIVNLDGREFVSATDVRSHEAFTNSRAFNRARFYPGVEVKPDERDKAWELMSSILGLRVNNTIEDIDKGLISCLSEKFEQLKRLQAGAEALELPILSNLKNLGKAIEEIIEAPSASRRILSFIEDQHIKILKENIPLLERLVDFEKRGNLKVYKTVNRFVSEYGQKLVKFGEEKEEKIRNLSEALNCKDFIDRWPDIISGFESLREKYEKLYRELHKKRNDLLSNVFKSLESHELRQKDEKEFTKIVEPLKKMICPSEKVELNENFVCNVCRASLEELDSIIKTVEIEKQKIISELNKRLIKIEPTFEELIGFREKIMSHKDLQKVTEKLKKVSEKAIERKKIVKVDVRVE